MMKQLLALLFVFSCIAQPVFAASVGGGSIQGGGIGAPWLIEPPPETGDFMLLEDSPIWGTGGTLADIPSYIGFAKPLDDTLPLKDSEFTTTNTSLGGSCSSDNTTFAALVALLDTTSGNVADRTTIVLPPCTIKAFHNHNGDASSFSWDHLDYIKLKGTPGQTYIEVVPNAVAGASNWDSAAGDVNRAAFGGGNLFVIGPSDSDLTALSGPCSIEQTASAPAAGEDTFQMECEIDTTGAAGVQWGAGDVVRFTHTTFANAGATSLGGKVRFMTRLRCVRDTNGVESGDCTDVPPGDNMVRTWDPVLTSFATTAGTHYAATPTDLAIEQLERVGAARGGVGTETSRMAEYIGFEGIGFKRAHPQFYERKSYVRATRVADLWFTNDLIEPGSAANFNFKWSAGRVLFFRNKNTGPYLAATCFGKINSLQRSNPGRLVVQSGACCGLRSEYQTLGTESGPQCPDKKVAISANANIPGFAGKMYARTIITPNLTSSGTTLLEIQGADWTGLDVASENPGGTITALDDFGHGYSYTSTGASNVQHVNNSYQDRRSPFLIEAGGYGHAVFGIYDRHSTSVSHSRTDFPHGNSGAPGALFEKNDTDGAVTLAAQSNGAPNRHGEGVGRMIAFNRLLRTTPSTITGYADTKSRGTLDNSEDDGQQGFANEGWGILGNLMYDVMTRTNYIDEGANNGGGGAAVPPYLLYKLKIQANRCYASGCNLNSSLDPDNPSTVDSANVSGDAAPEPLISLRDSVPSSISRREKPWWWCDEAVAFERVGALWDDVSGGIDSLEPLPSRILAEDGVCTHTPRADGYDWE